MYPLLWLHPTSEVIWSAYSSGISHGYNERQTGTQFHPKSSQNNGDRGKLLSVRRLCTHLQQEEVHCATVWVWVSARLWLCCTSQPARLRARRCVFRIKHMSQTATTWTILLFCLPISFCLLSLPYTRGKPSLFP